MIITVIRTDGSEEKHEIDSRYCFTAIGKLIGARPWDSVSLRDGRLMLVADAGYETETVVHKPGHIEIKPIRARKPANEKATQLYWSICKSGTDHKIVGDVAIVCEHDFGD